MVRDGVNGQWNFGPEMKANHTVIELVESFSSSWGHVGKFWKLDLGSRLPETKTLLLDSTKARLELGWKEKLDFDLTVDWTADWYKNCRIVEPLKLTLRQIETFLSF
jgi:CDP-glucose 4,6-dehydratase